MQTQDQYTKGNAQVQEPFAINKFEHHTFLASIHTKVLGNVLNLRKLAVEFKTDIELNQERTLTKQNSVVIDKAVKICSTRSKNKQVMPNSNGFVKLSFPDDQDSMYYSNPPDIIPYNCYCTYCDIEGPYAHSNYCKKPKKNQLRITIDAFIDSIYSGTYKVKGYLAEDAETFCKILKDNKIDFKSKTYKTKIDDIIKNIPSSLYENLFNIDRKHMNISLSDILVLTKRDKEGKYFTGPIMVKYKLGTKNITIRIRKNGNIEFISNPWSAKHFYLDTIKRINNTSQKVEFIEGDIRTFFSSVNLFNSSNYTLDLNKVYQYLWPINTTYPKYQIGKGYYIFSENDNVVYKYEMRTDKVSKSRLYIDLVKCLRQENEIIVGNYKISVQLFAQGHLQTTFGYYSDNAPKYNLDEQFDIIQKLFVEVQNLFLFYLSKLILIEKDLIADKEKKKVSKKIFETVIGIMPYAKRKKFRIGDKCNIFNYDKKAWSELEWTVIRIETVQIKESQLDLELDQLFKEAEEIEAEVEEASISEVIYVLEYTPRHKTNKKKIKNCKHSDIRKIEPNNDQVCRLNENSIPRQPYPYSFFGQTPGGLDQYINPIGLISRSDNNFYPYSESVTSMDEKWILNFLLNGFSKYEINKGFFNKMENSTDIYCGTFKPGTALIGSIVNVQHPVTNEYVNVQIIDKNKTHGLGNDNNIVVYKVVDVDSIGSIGSITDDVVREECDDDVEKYFEVTGTSFNKDHLENRFFRGILNMDIDITEVLMSCAEKLHLIIREKESEKESETESEKVFKETLLSKYNIDKLCESSKEAGTEAGTETKNKQTNIDYTIVIPEYLEDCKKCILYVQRKEEGVFTYTMIKPTELKNNVIKVYGYFIDKDDVNNFYPIKMMVKTKNENEYENEYKYVHHIDNFANELPNRIKLEEKNESMNESMNEVFMHIISDHISYNSVFKFIDNQIRIKDYVYNNMPYIILFSVTAVNAKKETKNKLYKWCTINRNIINLNVKEISKNKIKTKINFKKYNHFDYKLAALIDKDVEKEEKAKEETNEAKEQAKDHKIKVKAKIGDMISFKPNVMLDGNINPIVPVLDLQISNNYTKETPEDVINYIFGRINIETFRKKKWIIGNEFAIKEVIDDEGRSILVKEEL